MFLSVSAFLFSIEKKTAVCKKDRKMGNQNSRVPFDISNFTNQKVENFNIEYIDHPLFGTWMKQKVILFDLIPSNIKVYALIEDDYNFDPSSGDFQHIIVEYDTTTKCRRSISTETFQSFEIESAQQSIYCMESSQFCGDMKPKYCYTLHSSSQKMFIFYVPDFFCLRDDDYIL
jgi:hypothetical protein